MGDMIYEELPFSGLEHAEKPLLTSWESDRKHVLLVGSDIVTYMVKGLRKATSKTGKSWTKWEDISVTRFSLRPVKDGSRRLNVYGRKRVAMGRWGSFRNLSPAADSLVDYIPISHFARVFSEVNTMVERVTGSPAKVSFSEALAGYESLLSSAPNSMSELNAQIRATRLENLKKAAENPGEYIIEVMESMGELYEQAAGLREAYQVIVLDAAKFLTAWLSKVIYPMLPDDLSDVLISDGGWWHISPVLTDFFRAESQEEYTSKVVGARNSRLPAVVDTVMSLKPHEAAFLRVFKPLLTPELVTQFKKSLSDRALFSADSSSDGMETDSSEKIPFYYSPLQVVDNIKRLSDLASTVTKVNVLLTYAKHNSHRANVVVSTFKSIPKREWDRLRGSINAFCADDFISAALEATHIEKSSQFAEQEKETIFAALESKGYSDLFVKNKQSITVNNVYGGVRNESVWFYQGSYAVQQMNPSLTYFTVMKYHKDNPTYEAALKTLPTDSKGMYSGAYLSSEYFIDFVDALSAKAGTLLKKHKVSQRKENRVKLMNIMLTLNLGFGSSIEYSKLPERLFDFLGAGYSVDTILLLMQTKLSGQVAHDAAAMPPSWFVKVNGIPNPGKPWF